MTEQVQVAETSEQKEKRTRRKQSDMFLEKFDLESEDQLLEAIRMAKAMRDLGLGQRIDAARLEPVLRELVTEAIAAQAPRRIEIVREQTAIATLEESTHFQFELALRAVASGVNVYLYGERGTGKSTIARQIAKALGQPAIVQPVSSGLTSSAILGYMTADGKYCPSNLYHAYTKGYLYVGDEFDGAEAEILLSLNGLIDNRYATFPNGETIEAHKDFRFLAIGNTNGLGGNGTYTARSRLDAATLDRFCLLTIDRDDSLAAKGIGIETPKPTCDCSAGGTCTAQQWYTIWQAAILGAKGTPEKQITQRALRDGWKLLQAGIGLTHVSAMTINKYN